VGRALAILDRVEESQGALERCIAISPATADCLAERAMNFDVLGRCAEMEADLGRAVASNPKAYSLWYAMRAHALHALGRPPETVLEAYARAWEQLPERTRPATELFDRARLDIAAGKFT